METNIKDSSGSESNSTGDNDSSTTSTRLPLSQKLCYGAGHILNDLCASMWFSYFLLYFHSVLQFENVPAGNLVLIGQITDALSTPFVGIESDRTKTGFYGYGRRKSWHLMGVFCVVISYTFVFQQCITCEHADDWAKFIYYAAFIIIFQIGWASCQISHLALIPDIADNESERVELNAIRNAGTVTSNLVVFGLAWILLRFDGHGHSADMNDVKPADAPEFRLLVYIVVGLGVTFAIIFHLGTRERRVTLPPVDRDANIETSIAPKSPNFVERMTLKDWFKERQFYQIGLLYMCTRLTINVAQVYMPLYLTETQKLEKDSIASIPLVVYLSGFFTSMIIKYIDKLCGRKVTYAIGALLAVGACVNMYFLHLGMEMYGVAVVLGCGTNIMLITSLALVADLINKNVDSGAFVFGAMSFLDKVSNGVAVVVIQRLHPCSKCCTSCGWYFQHVMPLVPGTAAVIALLCIITLWKSKIGSRPHKEQNKVLQTCSQVPDADQHSQKETRPLLSSTEGDADFGSIQ